MLAAGPCRHPPHRRSARDLAPSRSGVAATGTRLVSLTAGCAASATEPTRAIEDEFEPECSGKQRDDLGQETDLLRHGDELGHGFRAHLLHHPAAMDFDRLLGRAELHRDLLVQLPGDDEREDFALSRRERADAPLELAVLSDFRVALATPDQRAADRVEQLAIVARLLEEVEGASLHRPHAHRNVAIAGEEDDRQDALS